MNARELLARYGEDCRTQKRRYFSDTDDAFYKIERAILDGATEEGSGTTHRANDKVVESKLKGFQTRLEDLTNKYWGLNAQVPSHPTETRLAYQTKYNQAITEALRETIQACKPEKHKGTLQHEDDVYGAENDGYNSGVDEFETALMEAIGKPQ